MKTKQQIIDEIVEKFYQDFEESPTEATKEFSRDNVRRFLSHSLGEVWSEVTAFKGENERKAFQRGIDATAEANYEKGRTDTIKECKENMEEVLKAVQEDVNFAAEHQLLCSTKGQSKLLVLIKSMEE